MGDLCCPRPEEGAALLPGKAGQRKLPGGKAYDSRRFLGSQNLCKGGSLHDAVQVPSTSCMRTGAHTHPA